MAASAATTSRPPLTRRLLGRHPIGYVFVAPYVVFLFAIFAYPLGFAVYMSFYDYFFAAPGRSWSGRSSAWTTTPPRWPTRPSTGPC